MTEEKPKGATDIEVHTDKLLAVPFQRFMGHTEYSLEMLGYLNLLLKYQDMVVLTDVEGIGPCRVLRIEPSDRKHVTLTVHDEVGEVPIEVHWYKGLRLFLGKHAANIV